MVDYDRTEASLEAPSHSHIVVKEVRFVVKRDPDPEWYWEMPRSHPEYVLAYALSGKAWYSCNGAQVEVGAGDLLLFPKALRRVGRSDPEDPWRFYSVGFQLHFFDKASERAFHRLPYRAPTDATNSVMRLLHELEHAWIAKPPGSAFQIRGLLSQLLGLFIYHSSCPKQAVPHADTMQAIVEQLQGDFTRRYSVQELARMAELSPSRFNVLFKSYTGDSAIQYQNRLRLERAKDLLLSGACNVTEAAQELGFSDVYYFSRLFKKVVGVPPSHYLP